MDSPSIGKLLKIMTSTNIKININISEAVTSNQHLSIMLCYLATWNTFEDLQFSIWTWLLLCKQKDIEWMLYNTATDNSMFLRLDFIWLTQYVVQY